LKARDELTYQEMLPTTPQDYGRLRIGAAEAKLMSADEKLILRSAEALYRLRTSANSNSLGPVTDPSSVALLVLRAAGDGAVVDDAELEAATAALEDFWAYHEAHAKPPFNRKRPTGVVAAETVLRAAGKLQSSPVAPAGLLA